MGNTGIYHGKDIVLPLLLVVKNVTGDVDDLNHGPCLVVVTNEVFDFKLYVLSILILDYLENKNSFLRMFHL